jgi:molybdopterin molybdotransferase
MLSVSEARQRILASLQPLETEALPLRQAAGRILAGGFAAVEELPPFDNSGVDGFALRQEDTADANRESPAQLTVIGDIPAGQAPDITIRKGQAARIMTGALIPNGADAVVMVEETDFGTRAAGTAAPERVSVYAPARPGQNIRKRGSDVTAGQEVLPARVRLRPQDLGLLAMLGAAQVRVHRRPRVAILSSGDELLPVDAVLEPGKVREANSYALAALAESAGGEVLRLGIAADRREAVEALLETAAADKVDMILSSAGVSVGAFDYVKEVVEARGRLDFWKVNMRPGKPLAFGAYRGIPFFGLPGNPVSAFIGFEVFVRPALQRLGGLEMVDRPRLGVILGEGVESDGRESYLRAQVDFSSAEPVARLTGHQGSGNLFSLVCANALLIIPSGVKSLAPGARVDAWLLENGYG